MTTKTAVKPEKKQDDILAFCAMCFATGEGGSWGESVVVNEKNKNDSHCFNCGAGGIAVQIPRWAVESIREQASWVGKRYYPNDEDLERYDEVKALRALVKKFPYRSVERIPDRPDDRGSWWVHQELPGGKRTSTTVKAKTAEEAFEKGRLLLPYIPKEALGKKCKKKP